MGFKKRLIPVLLIILLMMSYACTSRDGEFPSINMDFEGVEGISPVEGFFTNTVETFDFMLAGLVVMVFTEDEIKYELQHGYADIAAGLAVDSYAVFEWGSIAKLLVYVSVMQLYERGQLDLHASIFDYIPQEHFPKIAYTTTMHHLINHTAGFENDYWLRHREQFNDFVPAGEPVANLEDRLIDIFLNRFTIQSSPPGHLVRYSNEGIALAGYIISQISRLPFYAYVHKNIFAPLGMTRTALLPDLSDNDWVSTQRDKIRTYERQRKQTVQRWHDTIYPSGSATGTISDMITFARALIPDENGASILFERPETLSKLFPLHGEIQNIPMCILTGFRFFNGIIVYPLSGESYRVLGHTGGTKGFRSQLMIDIDRGIGLVICENNVQGMLWLGVFPHGLAEMVFK